MIPPSNSPAPAPRSPVVSLPVLGGVAVLSILGAAYLIPKEDELWDRLSQDQNTERMAQLYAERQELAENERIRTEMEAIRARYGTTLQAGEEGYDARETLDRILGAPKKDFRMGQIEADLVASALGVVDVVKPDEGFSLVKLRADEIPDVTERRFYKVLAHNALGAENPALAAEILLEACKLPGVDWETARDAVQAARWAAQPERAVEALDLFAAQFLPDSRPPSASTPAAVGSAKASAAAPAPVRAGPPEEYTWLRYDVLLEVGRPAEAFSVARRWLESLGESEPIPEEEFEKIVRAGYQGDRAPELLPIFRRFLHDQHLTTATWEEVRDAAKRHEGDHAAALRELDLTPANFERSKLFAQMCEWYDAFDEGFDMYRKLAVLGDEEALDRCVDLYISLQRGEELAELMLETGPVSGNTDHSLILAQILGNAVRYDEAEAIYHDWLDKHTADLPAALELGALQEEMGNIDAAIDTYRAIAMADAALGEVGTAKLRLANVLIGEGRHREAFEIYRALPPGQHAGESLEAYALLAESLGEDADLNRALRLQIESKEVPEPKLILDYSATFVTLGEPEAALDAIREAVERWPDSHTLRIAYATELREFGRIDEAFEVFNARTVASSVEAAALFCEIAAETELYAEAMPVVRQSVTQPMRLPAAARIALGQILEYNGEFDEAERLYDSVGDDQMTRGLLARVKFKQLDLAAALDLQKRHLAQTAGSDPDEWVFLGEIYDALGEPEKAQAAFQESLSLILNNPSAGHPAPASPLQP